MERKISGYLLILILLSSIFTACSKDPESPTQTSQPGVLSGENGFAALDKAGLDSIIVVANGLNQPRGLIFGPDLALYISESGFGGFISTIGECEQVPPPVGPYLGANNGSITKVTRPLEQFRINSNFPSTQTAPTAGSDNTSISSLAFYNGRLYALLSGAGCSHGHPEIPNGILRVDKNNGSWDLIADISSFLKANPVANPEEGDFEPDGDLYSMIRVDNSLYFIESNHGELDRYDILTGEIERIVDLSAIYGHLVPTAITYKDGFFYVGNLTTIPFPVGAAMIIKISKDGSSVSTFATGFTTILGLTFDLFGNLYVLESTVGNGQPPFFFPNTGRIKRISRSNLSDVVDIVTGLNFPTAMTLGPDGNLYVSVNGYGSAPGQGEVIRVKIRPPIRFINN